MNTRRVALIVLLLSPWLLGSSSVPDPANSTAEVVDFHFVAKAGDMTRTRTVTRTFGSMNMFGSLINQKFSQNFEQEVVLKCTEVRPDGSSIFEMTLGEIAMKMNFGGMTIEVDTREENPPPASMPVFDVVRRLLTAMTTIKCTVTFSPEGEPLEVEGLSEGMEAIMSEISDQLVPGLRQFFDQFRDYLADDIMAEQMRSAFRIYPDNGKARPGDTWTRQWQVNMPPFSVMTEGRGEYEFLEMREFRGRPCAKIRVRSTLTTLPGQKPDLSSLGGVSKSVFQRMQFSMNSRGLNGVAYVDPSTGDLLHFRETQRITIEISMDPDPHAEGELKEGLGKITQRLTTSVQIDLVEKNGQTFEP